MDFKVHYIGSGLQEMSCDEISTGTMTEKESINQSMKLVDAAHSLMTNNGIESVSDLLWDAILELEKYIVEG